MKFVLISDYLPDEVLGGCEINNAELAIALRDKGHTVFEKKAAFISQKHISSNPSFCYIISNFIELSPSAREELKKCSYVIYEHDHKYLRSRNPADFEGFKAPPSDIINLDFYRQAHTVFCQTEFHTNIVRENTQLNNVVNLGGNFWSEKSLEVMEKISDQKKKNRVSILQSAILHKNTIDAVRYCQYKDRAYDLVSSNNYYSFLTALGANSEFVFFPKTPETLSRVVCEARMMNMEVTTNDLVGATKEPWFSLRGKELIKHMREHKKVITTMVQNSFAENV